MEINEQILHDLVMVREELRKTRTELLGEMVSLRSETREDVREVRAEITGIWAELKSEHGYTRERFERIIRILDALTGGRASRIRVPPAPEDQ